MNINGMQEYLIMDVKEIKPVKTSICTRKIEDKLVVRMNQSTKNEESSLSSQMM